MTATRIRQSGDGLVPRRRVRVGCGVGGALLGGHLGTQDDVDRVAWLDQEAGAGDGVNLEPDRSLAGLQRSAEIDRNPATPGTDGCLRDLASRGDVGERRLSADLRRIGQRIGRDRVRVDVLGLDLVRGHRVADGDGGLRDEDLGGRHLAVRVVGSALAVEDHDDADEREHGQQHADEDDETIGSLHETFPLQLGRGRTDEIAVAGSIVPAVNSLGRRASAGRVDLWATREY